MIVKCRNCGHRHVVKLFWTSAESSGHNNKPGLFQHTQPIAPVGLLRSFWWRVVRNKPLIPPLRPNIIVRSETRTSPKQLLIAELEIPANEHRVGQLAQAYCNRPGGLGLMWSRAATVKRTDLSQTGHNKMTEAFRELRFLDIVRGDEDNPLAYGLNDAGKRFLRHYLPTLPEGAINEKLHPVNKQ